MKINESIQCMEEVNKEELDVFSLSDKLYSLPNTLKFRNRIAQQIIYIRSEKYKNNTTMFNSPPGHIKFSQNCNVLKNIKTNKIKNQTNKIIARKIKELIVNRIY